jgi:hypothetical protein
VSAPVLTVSSEMYFVVVMVYDAIELFLIVYQRKSQTLGNTLQATRQENKVSYYHLPFGQGPITHFVLIGQLHTPQTTTTQPNAIFCC